MSGKNNETNQIKLDTIKPTALTFAQLYNWVIWQVPRKKEGGLSGAVRSSAPGANWYPAIIHPKEKRALVYGHLDTSFESPEKAIEWISNHSL